MCVAILIWMWGCAIPHTLIKDFRSRKPRTVGLLPVLNQTNDLDAPKGIRPLIYKALLNRGYVVRPLAETDELLRSREIREAGQIYTMTFRELGELLEVDALLVSNVLDWSTVYLIVYSSVTVEAEFQLIDTKTEQVLWKSNDKVSKRSVPRNDHDLFTPLEAAIEIPYSSLAKKLIRRCFATLPHRGVSNHPQSGKTRYRRRKVIFLPRTP